MGSSLRRFYRFYVNRLSITYAATGAVNAIMIDGWLYVLTHYGGLPLPVSTLIAVVTSIFTDYTWKSKVVFRSPLLSRSRFSKYFLNGSAATVIQYVLTLALSAYISYTIAYVLAVAVGFGFAYTISRLAIWKHHTPTGPGAPDSDGSSAATAPSVRRADRSESLL
ncbi:MAG: GtrA family protein [Nitrososphaerales archaeon]|jgi:putative flippase GtrA